MTLPPASLRLVGATLDLKGFLALSAKYASSAAAGFPSAHASKYMHDRGAAADGLADLDHLDQQNRGASSKTTILTTHPPHSPTPHPPSSVTLTHTHDSSAGLAPAAGCSSSVCRTGHCSEALQSVVPLERLVTPRDADQGTWRITPKTSGRWSRSAGSRPIWACSGCTLPRLRSVPTPHLGACPHCMGE